jgi:hypothetical protein
VWDELTLEDLQSVFFNWIEQFEWVSEHGENTTQTDIQRLSESLSQGKIEWQSATFLTPSTRLATALEKTATPFYNCVQLCGLRYIPDCGEKQEPSNRPQSLECIAHMIHCRGFRCYRCCSLWSPNSRALARQEEEEEPLTWEIFDGLNTYTKKANRLIPKRTFDMVNRYAPISPHLPKRTVVLSWTPSRIGSAFKLLSNPQLRKHCFNYLSVIQQLLINYSRRGSSPWPMITSQFTWRNNKISPRYTT